jgi:hypothetical protein
LMNNNDGTEFNTEILITALWQLVYIIMIYNYILAAQHVRQLVFTHRLGQCQASVVLAARVVEVRMVKNS